jgi:hypothetical protein
VAAVILALADMTNADRAERAFRAVQHYADGDAFDHEEHTQDLMTDLMHYCDERGMDFDFLLSRARNNYTEECKHG